ncbi:MAG: endonuclease [Marinilabiliales bacterium]|nr:MAG: endonuclease [Marinilabiliales bacterium]
MLKTVKESVGSVWQLPARVLPVVRLLYLPARALPAVRLFYLPVRIFLVALLLQSLLIISSAAGTGNEQDSLFRIIFYNVENLFDTANDPLRNDDDFTPDGARRWTVFRLQNKINNLYRAIVAAGDWHVPAIIGLCEVENRYVLEMLVNRTGLGRYRYGIVHRNSADRRGIDVAILYRPDRFELLAERFIPVSFPFDTVATTRDIVYIKGVASLSGPAASEASAGSADTAGLAGYSGLAGLADVAPADTLHLFANHWPSRWGGVAESSRYRNYAALVLRSLTDSIFSADPDARIVIMGDFNDEPGDASLKNYLGAGFDYREPEAGRLYNISHENMRGQRSYKFRGEWFLFDQFIVSGALLGSAGGLRTSYGSVSVFAGEFLLVPDDTWFGYKPFRSYEGFRYTGGFSDHLPVVLDLFW